MDPMEAAMTRKSRKARPKRRLLLSTHIATSSSNSAASNQQDSNQMQAAQSFISQTEAHSSSARRQRHPAPVSNAAHLDQQQRTGHRSQRRPDRRHPPALNMTLDEQRDQGSANSGFASLSRSDFPAIGQSREDLLSKRLGMTRIASDNASSAFDAPTGSPFDAPVFDTAASNGNPSHSMPSSSARRGLFAKPRPVDQVVHHPAADTVNPAQSSVLSTDKISDDAGTDPQTLPLVRVSTTALARSALLGQTVGQFIAEGSTSQTLLQLERLLTDLQTAVSECDTYTVIELQSTQGSQHAGISNVPAFNPSSSSGEHVDSVLSKARSYLSLEELEQVIDPVQTPTDAVVSSSTTSIGGTHDISSPEPGQVSSETDSFPITVTHAQSLVALVSAMLELLPVVSHLMHNSTEAASSETSVQRTRSRSPIQLLSLPGVAATLSRAGVDVASAIKRVEKIDSIVQRERTRSSPDDAERLVPPSPRRTGLPSDINREMKLRNVLESWLDKWQAHFCSTSQTQSLAQARDSYAKLVRKELYTPVNHKSSSLARFARVFVDACLDLNFGNALDDRPQSELASVAAAATPSRRQLSHGPALTVTATAAAPSTTKHGPFRQRTASSSGEFPLPAMDDKGTALSRRLHGEATWHPYESFFLNTLQAIVDYHFVVPAQACLAHELRTRCHELGTSLPLQDGLLQCKMLATLLSTVYFSSFWDTCQDTEDDIRLRSIYQDPLDCQQLILTAVVGGRLVSVVPWLCTFLSGMAKNMRWALTEQFSVTIAMLHVIRGALARSPRLTRTRLLVFGCIMETMQALDRTSENIDVSVLDERTRDICGRAGTIAGLDETASASDRLFSMFCHEFAKLVLRPVFQQPAARKKITPQQVKPASSASIKASLPKLATFNHVIKSGVVDLLVPDAIVGGHRRAVQVICTADAFSEVIRSDDNAQLVSFLRSRRKREIRRLAESCIESALRQKVVQLLDMLLPNGKQDADARLDGIAELAALYADKKASVVSVSNIHTSRVIQPVEVYCVCVASTIGTGICQSLSKLYCIHALLRQRGYLAEWLAKQTNIEFKLIQEARSLVADGIQGPETSHSSRPHSLLCESLQPVPVAQLASSLP